MADKKQRLVLSILDFLSQSLTDGTIKSDDKEGLEVAIQCIGEAFGVDPEDEQQRERLSIRPATLPSIFDVYLRTKEKLGSSPPSVPAAKSDATPPPSSAPKTVSANDKVAAEKLKQAGNTHMTAKDYTSAIKSYTDAIALDPTNPVYYSNRAAAHSSVDDHYSAIDDAQKALDINPKFTKAYSRMGHAHFCMEQYDEALSAFEKGLALDPTSEILKENVERCRTKLAAASTTTPATRSAPSPATPDLQSMLGGGAGGAGGMPDMSSFLNNPAMMAAAQQMMAGGGLESLMSNPSVRRMAERMQSGGGMPSMAEIMGDPALRDLANQFGGGAGGPRGT